jgi:hypothetical protein
MLTDPGIAICPRRQLPLEKILFQAFYSPEYRTEHPARCRQLLLDVFPELLSFSRLQATQKARFFAFILKLHNHCDQDIPNPHNAARPVQGWSVAADR